jgi:hypothetical protein
MSKFAHFARDVMYGSLIIERQHCLAAILVHYTILYILSNNTVSRPTGEGGSEVQRSALIWAAHFLHIQYSIVSFDSLYVERSTEFTCTVI